MVAIQFSKLIPPLSIKALATRSLQCSAVPGQGAGGPASPRQILRTVLHTNSRRQVRAQSSSLLPCGREEGGAGVTLLHLKSLL